MAQLAAGPHLLIPALPAARDSLSPRCLTQGQGPLAGHMVPPRGPPLGKNTLLARRASLGSNGAGPFLPGRGHVGRTAEVTDSCSRSLFTSGREGIGPSPQDAASWLSKVLSPASPVPGRAQALIISEGPVFSLGSSSSQGPGIFLKCRCSRSLPCSPGVPDTPALSNSLNLHERGT